jgi:hypothetical protein
VTAEVATANAAKTKHQEHLGAQQAEMQEKEERLSELSLKQVHA